MGKHFKKKEKDKITKIFSIVLTLVFVVIFIISSIKIFNWYKENKDNEKILEEISQAITIQNKDNEEDEYRVDFKKLKEKNEDFVAWVKVNGTDIEYAVVQASDNDYYLNRNFEKEFNKAGWIFADYRNQFDEKDKNIILYGHNRLDGSMFGSLKNVLNSNWYDNKDNLKINFITESETSLYEVFSVYQIKTEDYYITTNFKSDDEYDKFLKTIKARSKKDFNVNLLTKDSILTLSTCANNYRDRIVLHAKKIK